MLWALLVIGGFAALYAYKASAGAEGSPVETWPRESSLTLDADRPTLVMIAHPQCPCTRASISELDRLLARVGNKVHSHVLFVRPEGVDDAWERSALWRSAAAIPGVTVHEDAGGVEARRFGVETSGHVLIYASSGELMFRGGITASRGHEGRSFGQARIVALLTDHTADRKDSPVFGCSLFEHAIASRQAAAQPTY